MPTKAELLDVIQRLRHAPSSRVPLEVVERVQHTIVRLQQMLAAPSPPAEADALVGEAQQLIEHCATMFRK